MSVEGNIPFVVDGNTYQTWYKVFGDLTNKDQIPLVILHGGPGLTHDYLISISDLAPSRPIIFYDQLGNGRSTHLNSALPSFWNIELFVNELDNLITQLGIQSAFDLLGHSWGGMLGAEYEVQRQPAGLKHLVVSDSLAAVSLWCESNRQLASAFPREVQEGLCAGFSDLPKYRAALDKFHAVHGCTVQPIPKELEHSIAQLVGDDGDSTVAIAMFGSAIKEWSIVDRLHLVRVPTLVINGRADIAQDFVVEPFFTKIAKVKWITFEGSSHTPMLEERERYMKVVADFLTL